jgi:DNA repair protein RadA/Sms
MGAGETIRALPLDEVSLTELGSRIPTGFPEIDRVLGGGFMPGSVCLLGGDPGIGKSTLVLQMLGRLGQAALRTLYVTGEESAPQIKSRAERLGLGAAGIHLLPEVDLERILAAVAEEQPDLVVIDSIQTVRSPELESPAGGIGQVRASAARIIEQAKARAAAVLLIGHVTKDGALAGPRTLEHMVDVVLYLEGEGDRPQRVLRSVKNRFGSIHEIGLFRMTGEGLAEVSNPSALFLQERLDQAPGTVVFAGMEGTRPLLIEIQALVGEHALAYPRKTAAGMDANRLALLQAVLEKHLGAQLSGLDLYVNVVGGLRLSEPALDAAVVAALLSSFRNRPVDPGTVVFGEVGLTGELRAVHFTRERLAEANRLGFRRAVIPERNRAEQDALPAGLEVLGVARVAELAQALLP